MAGEERVERPHPSAQWVYVGEWEEFEANHRQYRRRLARADDGSWERMSVEHKTRNGWAHVGKKVNEGIEIGLEMNATLIEDLARELQAEIEERYGESIDHPAMAHKVKRDMHTVERAREVLMRTRRRL